MVSRQLQGSSDADAPCRIADIGKSLTLHVFPIPAYLFLRKKSQSIKSQVEDVFLKHLPVIYRPDAWTMAV